MRPEDHPFDRTAQFDVVIASCGYETRSSYLGRIGVAGTHLLAITYPGPPGAAFESNVEVYGVMGWSLVRESELIDRLEAALSNVQNPRVCIDISSMPRRTLARLVEYLWERSSSATEVQFLYCPARFENSAAAAARVEPLSAGPVSEYFVGELRSPSVPIGLVVGLGLEPHRATGLIELIEPSRTWAFVSDSGDSRFTTMASELHSALFESSEASSLFHYDVRSLAEPYNALESLNFAAGLRYRLLFAPSGPKIFSLACLLVAAPRIHERPAVWRVGSAAHSEPLDIVEAGDVVASTVIFDHMQRARPSNARAHAARV